MTSDPIALYQELLAADLDRWIASIPELRQDLRERGCHYGGREFVKVLRPKLLTRSDYVYLDYVAGVLMGVFRRLCGMVLARKDLQDYLGFNERELRLLAPEPRCPDPCPFTRLDSFSTPNGPRFVELNGECPAGVGFGDRSQEAFLRHPLVRAFMERTGARSILGLEGLVDGLLKVWRASGGGTASPTILITDYLDLPTVPEFHIIREHLEAQGFTAILEDPRALDYRGGRLYAAGQAIDLVYRRVLTNEFLDREDQVQPLFEAYRDESVVMVNPFRAKTVHKKTCFALLSGDFLEADWLTTEEQSVIARTIPWTRKIRETATTHGGRTVDLIPFVLENRERFVLKPSDEYGGKGVTVGWETDATAFEAVMQTALEEGWVAQERIFTEEEPFPMLERDLAEQAMIVDLDPFIYFGKVHGVLARLAAGPLCNVTSGGGQVPVFILPHAGGREAS